MATSVVQKSPAGDPVSAPSKPAEVRLELAALIGILLIAALLRLPGLEVGPPALADDEAINGLDIYRIFAGYREPFLPNNNGREALFIYVQALSVALFGASAWSLRIVSALAGIGAVVATWAMARAMFGRWVGIFAAGILATLPWHVILSRVGLRAIMSPLIVALSLWLFWRVLQRGRWQDGAWLGVVLGIGLQTYLATRLIPLLLLVLLAGEWLFNRWLLPSRLKPLLLGAAIAAVLLAPLGWYYVRHPEDALMRQTQVVIGSSNPQGDTRYSSIADSIPRTLAMFNFHGDENWRHNVAGRPAFDLVTGVLFLVGIAISLRLLLRATPSSDQPTADDWGSVLDDTKPARLHPYAWLLLSFPVLLLPGLVTIESPHFLRTITVLPVAVTFPALGIVHGWRFLRDRLMARDSDLPGALRLVPPIVGAVFIGALAVGSYDLYWRQWAPSIQTWQAFTGSANPLLGWLREYQARGGDLSSVQISLPPMPPINQPPAEIGYSMLLDPYFPPLPSIPFLMPEVSQVLRLDVASTVLPLHGPRDRDQVHIAAGPDRFDLPQEYFPEAQLVERPAGPDGWPAYVRVDVPAEAIQARLAAMHSMDVDYGPVHLIGAAVSPAGEVRAGEEITVDLHWRVVQEGEVNYGPGAVLVGPDGLRWADHDRQGAVLGGWQPGDEFLSRHRLLVPADAPPGKYRVEAAMSRRSLFPQPTQIIRALGRPTELGAVQVVAPAELGDPPPPIGEADGRAIRPGLTLEQVAPLPTEARTGDEIGVVVRWQALGPMPATALQLVQGGQVVASSAAVPGASSPRWLRLRYSLQVPPSAASGEATLRLVTLGQDGAAVESLDLGPVAIQARERQFTPQPMGTSAVVQFGEQLTLDGWTIESSCVDERRTIRGELQWQALREIGVAYTVFLHVLGPDGAIVAQLDSQPKQGEYPTTAWQAREYVTDRFELPIPPAARSLPLRVIAGWYDAATGQRIPAQPGADAGPDYAILADQLPGC